MRFVNGFDRILRAHYVKIIYGNQTVAYSAHRNGHIIKLVLIPTYNTNTVANAILAEMQLHPSSENMLTVTASIDTVEFYIRHRFLPILPGMIPSRPDTLTHYRKLPEKLT